MSATWSAPASRCSLIRAVIVLALPQIASSSNEPVAQARDLGVGQPHPGEVGAVSADTERKLSGMRAASQARAASVSRTIMLADNQGGTGAQDAPRALGVGGRDQERHGPGGPVPGELELAGAERGQDPQAGRPGRLSLIELVEVVVQRPQRAGFLRAAQADDEPVRRAGLELRVDLPDRGGWVDIGG